MTKNGWVETDNRSKIDVHKIKILFSHAIAIGAKAAQEPDKRESWAHSWGRTEDRDCMSHEAAGKSDEWYTPRYIFDALGVRFDLDVAPALDWGSQVQADSILLGDGLTEPWTGFVWMNPPFGKRNGLIPWMDKFYSHGNGIALTPDRTSTDWWQSSAKRSDAILFISPKVKFIKPDGSTGDQPSNGTTLFAVGTMGVSGLHRASRSMGVLLTVAV